jgi:hypothetical protein
MLLTLRQAEKVTEYSTDTLRNRIKDGTIPAIKVKNRYMIEEKDLEPHIKKAAKSRVHEPSHAGRGVPQENPFSEQTEQMKVKMLDKIVDWLMGTRKQANIS